MRLAAAAAFHCTWHQCYDWRGRECFEVGSPFCASRAARATYAVLSEDPQLGPKVVEERIELD